MAVNKESIFKKDFNFRADLIYIFLLVAVAPFCVVIHFSPLGEFWENFIPCVGIAVGFIIVLLVATIKEKGLLVSPFALALTAFFALLCLVAFLQQVSLTDLAILAIYSSTMVATALLAIQLAQKNDTQYYDYLAFFLFFGGILESLGAIAIQYRLAGIDYWMVPMSSRMFGFVAQSNLLAIYVMIAFLALAYLTLRKLFHVTLFVAFSLLFGFVLLGSGSRAVLLYLVAIVGAGAFCLIKTKEKRFLVLIPGLVALFIGALAYHNLAAILGLFSPESSVVVADTSAMFGRSASSESFRLSEIQKCFELLKTSPLFGIGFGNYAARAFWLLIDNPDYVVLGDLTQHSHNFITQIMVEFGLVGLLALLAMLGYIGFCFWKTPKTIRWWFVFSVFSIFLINGFLEFAMWRIQFAVVLFLVLVPALTGSYRLNTPRTLNGIIIIAVAGLFMVVAPSSLSAYARSFFYSQSLIDVDPEEYAKFRDASENVLWGRYIRMQEFLNQQINYNDLAYLERITDETLDWQPHSAVLIKKLQLSVINNDTKELARITKAMDRVYGDYVPSVCSYFSGFSPESGRQALRGIIKGLKCRTVLAAPSEQ